MSVRLRRFSLFFAHPMTIYTTELRRDGRGHSQ